MTFHPLSTLPVGLPLLALTWLVGALAEEVGWRGLLRPVLRQRFGIVAASATVGLLWGIWHVGIFGRGPVFAAGFLAATVAMSLTMGAVIERVGGDHLLVASSRAGGVAQGIFHLIANLGMLLIVVGGEDATSSCLATWRFAAAATVAAAFWLWRLGRRGRLGRAGRLSEPPSN